MYKGRSDGENFMFELTDPNFPFPEINRIQIEIYKADMITHGFVHSPFDIGDKVVRSAIHDILVQFGLVSQLGSSAP